MTLLLLVLVSGSLSVLVLVSFWSQSPRGLVMRLVAVDLLFLAAHVASRLLRLPSGSPLYIDTDRGFAEVFQYLKMALGAAVWLAVHVRNRQPIMLGWSVLFGYLTLDDAGELHEMGGDWLAVRLAIVPIWDLPPPDVAQLVLGVGVGMVFVLALGPLYRRSDGEARRVSGHLALLTLALGFCGVVLDALHSAVDAAGLKYLGFGLGLAEDGGEMLVTSAVLAYARHLWTAVRGRVPSDGSRVS